MNEENILVEVSAEDKDPVISGFTEIGATIIDEIEVKRRLNCFWTSTAVLSTV
ncbi:MAG: hypothetical protein QNJ51_29930 [Calothrix sp. MO_167.B12]|nr:hypothetical protein [Calothrix sp. MO_167.B12]